MRTLVSFVATAVVGCASQPSGPESTLATGQAPAVSSFATSRPTESIEAQRMAAAKNLNLKVIDKDGQQLFCRSNLMTGSHIQRDATCYTADQVDHMQAQMERDLDRMNLRPSASPALPSK